MAVTTDDYIKFRERKRWLFFALPFTFTVYYIKVDDNDADGVDRPDMLTIDTGFFNSEENDCYLYKITDVKLTRSLFERIVGLGTVVCFVGGDATDNTIELKHIKNSREIKDYLLKASEKARLKRRTVNYMDISSGDVVVADGDAII